jgi:hypothetical protein
MRFPKTCNGWIALFWLTLRRCPRCHGPLCRDWPQYDTGGLWCLAGGGINVPEGFIQALRWNAGQAEQGQ